MGTGDKVFSFGEFRLDCGEEVLTSNGEPVALTPKALQMLKFLIENRGRAVTKEELLNEVWADSFVEESNIPFTVNRLRKALGDSKDQPRFIETVPRRGYRFIAPVAAPPADKQEPVAVGEPDTPQPAPVKQRKRFVLIPLVGTIAVTLAAFGVWAALRMVGNSAAPILSRPFSVEQLTTSGTNANAAVSPDGRYAAYTDESGGRESIWLRDLETSENVQIVPPSDDDYFGLAFSSNGKELYFTRKVGNVHALPAVYRVGTVGGIPVKLIDNVTERASLSPDGKHIAFVRCSYRKDDFCSPYVADLDGQNERKLYTTENGVHIWDLSYSPDGSRLAVSKGRFSNDRNGAAVYEVDPATGEERELFARRFYGIEGVAWLPDGNGLLFSASEFRDGKGSIWMVDRSTGELKMLSKDAASYTKLSLDRAGGKVVAVQVVPDFHVNVLANGVNRTYAGARDLAVSGQGRVFYSTFEGDIWSMGRDGSSQRQISNTPAAELTVCVSLDEKTVFFSSDDTGTRQVWRMNADGTERKALTQEVGGYPLTVSADGRHVYFANSLNSHIYTVPSDGGEAVLVYDKLLSSPSVSPGGVLVAHFTLETMSRKITITDLSTKEAVASKAPEPGHGFSRAMAWSPDGRTLYYVSYKDGQNTLWRWPIDTDASEKVADLVSGEIISLAVAGDGTVTYVGGDWRNHIMLLNGLG